MSRACFLSTYYLTTYVIPYTYYINLMSNFIFLRIFCPVFFKYIMILDIMREYQTQNGNMVTEFCYGHGFDANVACVRLIY